MTQLSQERASAGAAGGPNGGWVPPPVKRPSRTRRLLAASVLLALLVGVPTTLMMSVGSPLPASLPPLSDVAETLSRPLAPSLIVDALALVAWAAWAHFAVCLTVELSVAVRTCPTARVRPAPRVPLGGLSQQLARRLVEAALVTATVASSVEAGAGSGTILTPARPAVAAQEWRAPVPPAFAQQHEPAGSRPAATDPATGAVPERQAAPSNPEYVVQPPHGGYYDSLWDIAERFLGDGQRWREIYELNKSRDQPDGRALSRPELIRPGWMLYLPADATGLPAAGAEGEAPAQPAPPQAWGPTPTTSGVSPSASLPPVQAAPPAGPQDMASPLPSTAPRAGAGPAATGAVGPSPSATPYAEDPGGDSDEDEDDDNGPLQGQTLGGLLAAAVLAALATLRHRQRRRRPDKGSIPIPQPAVARAEGQLRVLAEPDDLEFVDETLRALTLSLQGRDVPDVRSALLRPGHLDLRLAQARPDAPPPFIVADRGLAWRVSTQERPLIAQGTSGQALPLLPLLLTVGRDADGPVLLDLEATGSLALQGAVADVLGLLTHLAAESVLAPWADGVEVLIAGFGPDVSRSLQLLAPDRVTAVNEIDRSLLRVLEMRSSRASASGERLSSRVRGSSADAKDEVRPPLLVVHAAQLTPLQAQQLAGLVPEAGRGGLAVVAPAPWPGARETWALGDALPLDTPTPTPFRLEADRLHALAHMLATAKEPITLEPPAKPGRVDPAVQHPTPRVQVTTIPKQPPVRALGTPLVSADPAPAGDVSTPELNELGQPSDELDRAVEAYLQGTAPATVCLLGPIAVHATGSIEPDRRARLTEIVAYLATHRRGVQLGDFDAALWPDRPVTLKTRNQAITRTRAWLGTDDEGVSWLRPLSKGTLRLSRRVLVDWELFEALQKRAGKSGRSRSDVRRDLETAMRLVRGRPLSQLPARRYGWLAETYLEQHIPSVIIDVAHGLAEILLEDCDADAVLEVARLAREVDRYDERPWRDLLQAHQLRGEHRQIVLLVDQLHELLEVELDDELQPETAELIERLAPRQRRA